MHRSIRRIQSSQPIGFTPYGHSGAISLSTITTGFNGTPFDTHANCYHLGQGYRQYFPRIMRFSSADRLSPFGLGGLNAYAYCNGDPVNYSDPQGTTRGSKTNRSAGSITGTEKFPAGLRPDQVTHQRIAARSSRTSFGDTPAEAGVNMALALREHEPDLFDNIAQYLEPGDLHWRIDFDSETRVKLFEISQPIYAAELERVIKGEKRQQKHNVLFTYRQHNALYQIRNSQERIHRASMRPYDRENFLDAQKSLMQDIKRARGYLEFYAWDY